MKIAFVYLQDDALNIRPHPLHREWAESVNAKAVGIDPASVGPPIQHTFLPDVWLNYTASVPAGYDLYILENPGLIYALPKFRRDAPGGEFVFLDTNWRRFGRRAYDFSVHSGLLKRGLDNVEKAIDGVLQRNLLRRFDGVISASELFAESIKAIPNNPPVCVCNPHISSSEWEELAEIMPDYESKQALIFGEVRGHKGQDLAVDAWQAVRQQHPEAELHLIGKKTEELADESCGVFGHGFVDEPLDYFQRASVAIHSARIDAFPVSTIETMAAGLPTLVSSETGTKAIVENVQGIVPTEPRPNVIANYICRYFNYSVSWRRETGKESREATRPYVNGNREFGESINELIKRMD